MLLNQVEQLPPSLEQRPLLSLIQRELSCYLSPAVLSPLESILKRHDPQPRRRRPRTLNHQGARGCRYRRAALILSLWIAATRLASSTQTSDKVFSNNQKEFITTPLSSGQSDLFKRSVALREYRSTGMHSPLFCANCSTSFAMSNPSRRHNGFTSSQSFPRSSTLCALTRISHQANCCNHV